MMKKLVLPIMLFVFTGLSCKGTSLPVENVTIQRADGETVLVKTEIADTQESRQRGFMFRRKIPSGTGMLFVFETDQILSFWMKDTPHPLSIAYIASDGTIRDILDMTPYSLSHVVSSGHVRYALEVPRGWFKENGVEIGARVIIDR